MSMRLSAMEIADGLTEMALDELQDTACLSDMEIEEIRANMNSRHQYAVWVRVVVAQMLTAMDFTRTSVAEAMGGLHHSSIVHYVIHYRPPKNMNPVHAVIRMARRLGWKEEG